MLSSFWVLDLLASSSCHHLVAKPLAWLATYNEGPDILLYYWFWLHPGRIQGLNSSTEILTWQRFYFSLAKETTSLFWSSYSWSLLQLTTTYNVQYQTPSIFSTPPSLSDHKLVLYHLICVSLNSNNTTKWSPPILYILHLLLLIVDWPLIPFISLN